jgi:ribosomal protein S18 acetylase RimI-like enzyme
VASFAIRDATPSDETFITRMLCEAASWRAEVRPREAEVVARPEVAVYLAGWGREGDTAVVAEEDSGRLLGAAWYRFFSEEEHGFGFVSADIPELTIAVEQAERGRGIGTALLDALIQHAEEDGCSALSLSVEEDNAALRLYERAGFSRIRQVHNAWTMRLDLIRSA